LEPSRYEELNQEAVDLLEAYGLLTFPLDIFELAGRMGICLRPYSSIPFSKRLTLGDVSKDAFTIAAGEYEVDTTFICYNHDVRTGRLRHSIAHEIAHIWLEHPSSEDPFETEAEYFAASLLAPIPLIIKNDLRTPEAIQKTFLTSLTAARISLTRANNRIRCGKPEFDYEGRLVNMTALRGGGSIVCA
jgi:hypothetical protein